MQTPASKGVPQHEIQKIGDRSCIRIDKQILSLSQLTFNEFNLLWLEQGVKKVFGKIIRFYLRFSISFHECFNVQGNDTVLVACKVGVGLTWCHQYILKGLMQSAIERTRITSNFLANVGNRRANRSDQNTIRP